MKFKGKLGEERQLVLPPEVIEGLRLEPGAPVEVEIRTVRGAGPHTFDEKKFREALDKYSGSMTEQMLAEGYKSVDELMDDIRPRW